MSEVKEMIARAVCLLFLLSPGQIVAAEPDFARETRLADEIVDVILDGDPEWLEADGREFLSIYTEADDSRAAILILHGSGFHPDWADTVNPLRVGLVERGYSTLSLQMPVLEKDATYYDYVPIFSYAHPRIEAGIKFLRDNGHQKIVLLAHSCGVDMAMDWIRMNDDRAIDAYVGLGMGATDYRQPMRQPFPLDGMQVPVLDLYGAEEFPAVIRMAPERKAMIKTAGHVNSRQVVLPDANHYFTDQDDPLVAEVANWLDQLE
jgi:pimeloyl-ACP methyl ester carboxylesterase